MKKQKVADSATFCHSYVCIQNYFLEDLPPLTAFSA